jgi:hypothetical protein
LFFEGKHETTRTLELPENLIFFIRNDSFESMFNVSFGEVLIVVTGAGLLLGRQEIVAGSRLLGLGLGKIIGTLQGLRAQYEEKSKGTEIYQLHSSVRDGLMDLSTIGSDLSRISPLSSQNRASVHFNQQNAQNQRPKYDHKTSNDMSLGHSLSPTSTSSERKVLVNDNQLSSERLAILVLAEGQLKKRMGRTVDGTTKISGADIIESVVSESIITSYYAQALKKAS